MGKKWKPTKTWARTALRATEKLIGTYKAGLHHPSRCPLCGIERGGCRRCPWVVFTSKADCGGYSRTPIPDRFPRLYGWVRRFNNIINR